MLRYLQKTRRECYEKGIGTEPDREKAGECREKAALLRQKQDVEIKERFRKILSSNGMLIKRPILIYGKEILLGFKQDDWKKINKNN